MTSKGMPTAQASGRQLARALAAVEGRLHLLYARNTSSDLRRRLAAIDAATDIQSPLWDEVLQIEYLENAREALQHSLRALDQRHGRPQ
ncbi:MAG: hypothetical protein GXX93_07210 [Anaerolineae bacterium]|nr:hypothetical protein [Anaerolineae bacterium]